MESSPVALSEEGHLFKLHLQYLGMSNLWKHKISLTLPWGVWYTPRGAIMWLASILVLRATLLH